MSIWKSWDERVGRDGNHMRTFGKQDGGQRAGLINRGRGPYY